jgi:RNA polymerase sigma-70 factor (ECF subfamily)
MRQRDPLADPERLIRRVYAYVAYRIGEGADAEDVTSEVFERAVRYRDTYDPRKGEPIAWLIGIARRSLQGRDTKGLTTAMVEEAVSPEDLELGVVDRLSIDAAVARLGSRDRDLISLRYGADLTAREIADVLGMTTNAVHVALHRALACLRGDLGGDLTRGEIGNPVRSAAPAPE